MHLLTLLIAAVLSSDFVAPNTFTAFEVDLEAVTVAQLKGTDGETLPVIEVTFAAAPASAPTGFISLENSATTTTKVDITTTVVSGSNTVKYNIAETDLTNLAATGDEPCIYIWLADTAMPTAPVSIQVPVAEAWTIAKDVVADFLDTDLVTTPKLKITATHTVGWAATGMKAKFSWTYDEGEDPREVELDITMESATYIIAAGQSLADLEILTADVSDDDVPLVVSIIMADGTTEYPLTADLAVTLDTPTFTMADTLDEVDTVVPIEYTITNPDPALTGKTAKAVFTTTKTVPAAATGDFAFPVTVSTAITFTADLTTFPFTDDLKEIYVYLHIVSNPADPENDGFRVAPATIAFTPEEAPVGSFTLTDATVEWKDRETTPNITVKLSTSPAATTPGPKARYEIVYAADPDNPVKVKGALGKVTGPPVSYYIAPTNLSDLGLTNIDATLDVYIFPTGTRNAYTTSKPLAVTASTAEFTVTPSILTSLTTIEKLTITATDGTDWSDDGIAVQLSFGTEDPIVKNLTLETAETNDEPTPKVFSLANVDITSLSLANGSVVTVKAAKARHATAPAWLSVPVSVNVTLPVVEEETFTLSPAWMLWAAALKTTEAIIVEPSKEVTWTTPKATFTYTAPGPVANDPEPVEVTLVKAGTPEKWTIPKDQSLAALEIPQPEEGKFASVIVTVHNGAKVLGCEFTFKVYRTAPGPGPETITFTLAPNKMDFATAMKTPVIEVKPGAGADWPKVAVPGALKATFKYSDKADIPVDLAVEGTTTIKYTIPKDVDLSGFGIKETELPKVIKVHVKDGAVDLTHVADFTVNKPGGSAAMGVSPLLSLLAAALLLLVKLF